MHPAHKSLFFSLKEEKIVIEVQPEYLFLSLSVKSLLTQPQLKGEQRGGNNTEYSYEQNIFDIIMKYICSRYKIISFDHI